MLRRQIDRPRRNGDSGGNNILSGLAFISHLPQVAINLFLLDIFFIGGRPTVMTDSSSNGIAKALDGSLRPFTTENGTLSKDTAVKPKLDDAVSRRANLDRCASSKSSVPPPGQILTGKQEHCMFLRTLR